jgi:hypothetical protein
MPIQKKKGVKYDPALYPKSGIFQRLMLKMDTGMVKGFITIKYGRPECGLPAGNSNRELLHGTPCSDPDNT